MTRHAPRLVVDADKRLPGFSLHVQLSADTETLVLFGPSGAGKTTTLNVVAGLVSPDSGEITLDGEILFRKGWPAAPVNLPARRRRIGYVFQSYALFPHLTALENVTYPLWRQRGAGQRAADLLALVHLERLAGRYPHELSGGQQQRVALARALAAQPNLLLLDEPFAALDSAVREQLQRELRALQTQLGLVVVYVTHRLEDAFAMGDRLAVVHDGRVAQVGSLDDVLRQPASQAVAEVMGIRNLLRVRVTAADAHGLQLDWAGLALEAPSQDATVGAEATAYIRPEQVKIVYPDRPISGAVGQNLVEGTITEVLPGASLRAVRVLLENGLDIEARYPITAYASLQLVRGARVRLALRREALVLLAEPHGPESATGKIEGTS